ncbi:DUF5808 domain-containing protein [Pseudofulvimonas gallinarii]|jgi:uncharacterized membrane protein|uniref:DUF5808 domain-containing protein n=1 Tax=Pseudofulvimonas gallinarii TaxID=634155 RepID=A0A4S3KZY7_9GAMM|nr:DUF5808 domain-containing protein [Pseudofulvimonas gallinarii]TCT01240.1 hypothetical protein EDC25_10195 [Pseudofulvimonas gallinarii]THD15003.1 hypothetical protein B1808_00950 [Pseudofulvimonas gallinarii]
MTAHQRPALTEQEQNEKAWNNPVNWTGPGWLGIYHAAEDSRAMVPKRPRYLGWTLNFAHPASRWFLAACVALVLIVLTIQLVL